MRRLLIWPLLAFVPFTGVRMVCIDRPATAVTSTAVPGGDCDQFCLRSSAASGSNPSAIVECMLFAEGSLLVVVSGVAVLPVQTLVEFELAPRKYASEAPDYYLAPVLARHNPPPRA